jgi:hypothetical protein
LLKVWNILIPGNQKNKKFIVKIIFNKTQEDKMRKILFVFFMLPLFFISCYESDGNVLISKKFIDDNTYEIICKGLPKASLTGVARIESSKRAALLNAYFFTRNMFGNSVIPDKEGTAEDFNIKDDYAVVTYVIRKKNLKKMLK